MIVGEPKQIKGDWVIMIYKRKYLGDGATEIKEYPLSNINTEIPFADEIIIFANKDVALKEMKERGIDHKTIEELIGGK